MEDPLVLDTESLSGPVLPATVLVALVVVPSFNVSVEDVLVLDAEPALWSSLIVTRIIGSMMLVIRPSSVLPGVPIVGVSVLLL